MNENWISAPSDKIKVIKVRDVRLDSNDHYGPGHGTTWAGVLRSIAIAIENPGAEVIYQDADCSHAGLLAIFNKLLDTNPTLERRIVVVPFNAHATSVVLRYRQVP